MRAQAMPGEDPETLPTAASVAEKIVPLAGAAMVETCRYETSELLALISASLETG